MLRAIVVERKLNFKRPSGTSRGILTEKTSWYLILEKDGVRGIGECNPLKGLSFDDVPEYGEMLQKVAHNPELYLKDQDLLKHWPSIRFGLEMAALDLENGGNQILFKNGFSVEEKGIPINGLVWMGDRSFMKSQIDDLVERGFTCIKMKIGAINFKEELALLKYIRQHYKEQELTIRVDANGAFDPGEAYEKLGRLSELNIHSIEQPIPQGQIAEMAKLCEKPPIPIALDEELIGVFDMQKKNELLLAIQPQYLIIKPSLLGGFQASEEWIKIANENNIDWWITSALESNIGLNAISQWTFEIKAKGYQGLGTGSLYTNNIPSPLTIVGERIFYLNDKNWLLNGIR